MREVRLELRICSNYGGDGIRLGRGGVCYLDSYKLYFFKRNVINCYYLLDRGSRIEWKFLFWI